MSLPRFRRFTLVTQSDPIEADGLHYLEVDVFEDDRLVGRLDLDESWFKTLNVSIRRDWSDSNALLTTFPSDWLESLDFEKPPNISTTELVDAIDELLLEGSVVLHDANKILETKITITFDIKISKN